MSVSKDATYSINTMETLLTFKRTMAGTVYVTLGHRYSDEEPAFTYVQLEDLVEIVEALKKD